MSRDPYKLEAFQLADLLVVELYRASARFPAAERFGLQAQLRRAAVSVAANLVEGCARRSQRDYLHFVGIAIGSASEVRYLVQLSVGSDPLTNRRGPGRVRLRVPGFGGAGAG